MKQENLKETLAYIIQKKNLQFFFVAQKKRMPNAFISTAFRKHLPEIINGYNRGKSSKLFFIYQAPQIGKRE